MDKIIRFQSSGAVQCGLVDGETVYETESLFSTQRGKARSLNAVRLLAPIAPSKIVCVGRNYVDHAKELNNPVPLEPMIFLKPPSALIATGDRIIYPKLSENVNYEGELGVVIGTRARFVAPEEAEKFILGYTCINDVTARDLQRKDVQFTRGKGFDTFCPAGPWIVRREDVDFDAVRVRTYLDGELKQDASVRDMIFPISTILAFITQVMTLEPGDLIATGTPAGVGPMRPGSVVRVEVQGVGAIENEVCV
ncbi:MAG: fumarylacetoacetate hydrolase family protein [Bryobacteraceae bacterium]